MAWFLDETKSKREFLSLSQKWITLYLCGCAVCERCWLRSDNGQCIYGGPFTGYESAADAESEAA